MIVPRPSPPAENHGMGRAVSLSYILLSVLNRRGQKPGDVGTAPTGVVGELLSGCRAKIQSVTEEDK